MLSSDYILHLKEKTSSWSCVNLHVGSVLFYWPLCLFSHQYHDAFDTTDLYCIFKSGTVISPTVFFLDSGLFLTIFGLLCFYITFSACEKCPNNFIEISLSPWVAFSRMTIFTRLLLLIHEHESLGTFYCLFQCLQIFIKEVLRFLVKFTYKYFISCFCSCCEYIDSLISFFVFLKPWVPNPISFIS